MKLKSLFPIFLSTLKSEDTVDALRNTLAVVLPIVFFFFLGWPTTGIGIGVGALVICMTDLPGNLTDKFNTAWISILLFTLVAMLTTWSTFNPLVMIAVMVVQIFVLAMFGAMGTRIGAVGLMAIALATFTIGLKPKDVLLYGSYTFLGGVWYYSISLLQIYIFPYRSIQRAIATTQQHTAKLMMLRAQGYDPTVSLNGFNEKNIRLHLKLASQHELLRQLLLSDPRMMDKQDRTASIYLNKALSLIDLYEQVTAVHYDYPYLRRTLANTAALPIIQQIIDLLARQLAKKIDFDFKDKFKILEEDLQQAIVQTSESEAKMLQQILGNLTQIRDLIATIYLDDAVKNTAKDNERYQEFLTAPTIETKKISSRFSLQSPIFRFAMRLTVLSFVALIIIASLAKEHYSYWLLLTMIVVSRPSYGITIRRNVERIVGSAIGIALGWLIATYFGTSTQLVISALFLFGFFAFNRAIYSVSVIFITTAVIICLHVYEAELLHLISDRALFTVIGVILCLAATFIFPIWNAPRLSDLVKSAIKANVLYFKAVVDLKPHDLDSIHKTRLARKYSHQQLAGLSEAILAAQHEPFHKNFNWSLIKRVQLLNFQLNALTAAFAAMQKTGRNYFSAEELARVESNLQECNGLNTSLNLFTEEPMPTWSNERMNLVDVSAHLAELLNAIVFKVSTPHD